jgi:hypothetical protein
MVQVPAKEGLILFLVYQHFVLVFVCLFVFIPLLETLKDDQLMVVKAAFSHFIFNIIVMIIFLLYWRRILYHMGIFCYGLENAAACRVLGSGWNRNREAE